MNVPAHEDSLPKRPKIPSTAALRALKARGIVPPVHTYRYVPRGGAAASSEALGWPLHAVVKTLVFERDDGAPVLVLMHGDREVSDKALARVLGAKRTQPCAPDVAERHSGYKVGGTSPFGTRRAMPVVAQATLRDLPTFLINAGSRGVLMALSPDDLTLLDPTWADVAR